MRVIDQDTGKHFYLDVSDELQAELANHSRSYCVHPKTEIRQRANRGGAIQLYYQCTTCGSSVGSAIKKTADLMNSPSWIDGRLEQYNAAHQARHDAIIQKYVRKQKNGDEGFKRKYDVYLASPAWGARRAKVLERAKGTCEGCLERKATQVHHLTYRHIFEEFMFELVAVCKECHERLHNDKTAEEGTEAVAKFVSEWEEHYPCDGCRFQAEEKGRRWCFILDQYAADALAPGGDCGPKHLNFEPLK